MIYDFWVWGISPLSSLVDCCLFFILFYPTKPRPDPDWLLCDLYCFCGPLLVLALAFGPEMINPPGTSFVYFWAVSARGYSSKGGGGSVKSPENSHRSERDTTINIPHLDDVLTTITILKSKVLFLLRRLALITSLTVAAQLSFFRFCSKFDWYINTMAVILQ